MKEILNILMVIYGIMIGVYLIMGLTKSKLEKQKEIQMTVVLMTSMLGNQLNKKKKVVGRIFLFQFFLLFGYTLISLWLTYNHSIVRIIAILLLIAEAIELIVRLLNIYKAENLKELIRNRKISKFSSYIYIVGIAILTGVMV
ncbi:hypothetical protein BKP56_09420 [Marinilactibacillus sp. 15R]|uniref:Uncharacterized protein n=1 Tax=Marinilactibacillus piezotolerans TaxID=258723 RepID=A0A1I3UME2_9LACT|nr:MULTISPECIES: hypothetical protein [Marinilactibacillus]API89458.1 hypothetical protein BKP56_09420 [Marinilactibacillus sp. 15R]SFJ84618.1 hypothetical protein SAMN04488569_100169 [Marinilactibacillus piezotolerans]